MTQPSPSIHLPLLRSGKVREVYEVDDTTLLMVASDRISAFDVVLPQAIPGKGEVLTQMTAWWLDKLRGSVAHHLLSADPDAIVERHPNLARSRAAWERRAMLVRRTDPVLVECVVRGYITGSAWAEYSGSGTLAGEALPEGLQESERLMPPLFSPATKAEAGEHDENITFAAMQEVLGDELAGTLHDLSLRIYLFGREIAERGGIILADTKFEFGIPVGAGDAEPILIDEVLTPDSSRFWPRESYDVGRSQPSLDKQPVRDWLATLSDWDRTPPAPDLPDEVVQATSERYRDAFKRLTGTSLSDYESPNFIGDGS